MDQTQNKRRAALAALAYLENGMTLGVGTGSTVEILIDALPAQAQRLGAVVSSSNRSTEKLRALGINVTELPANGQLDLYLDGADEATERRQLIKGGGGALTREKILAGAARRFVCMVDGSKVVSTLGGFPLPVEVIPMARNYVSRLIVEAGGQPALRRDFVTDNGNQILDVHHLTIGDPADLESRFNQIPGVVTVGLFALRPADVLLIGRDDGVQVVQ